MALFFCFYFFFFTLFVVTCRLTGCSRFSCSTPCEMLVPQPGTEPMSPALQDGFFTTGQPGKPLYFSVSKLLDTTLGPISLLAPTPNLTSPFDCGPSQLPQERFSAPGPWGTTHPLTTADNSARGFLPPTQLRKPICEMYSCLHLQPPS